MIHEKVKDKRELVNVTGKNSRSAFFLGKTAIFYLSLITSILLSTSSYFPPDIFFLKNGVPSLT